MSSVRTCFALRLLLSCGLLGFSPHMAAEIAKIKRPKLILLLVIDQFRADQIARFQSRFLAPVSKRGELGGFRYLLDHGAYFPYAEYGLLQNMTGPGHATILSGAYAYQHGISTNEWVESSTGKVRYCVDDPNSPLVGTLLKDEKRGASPRNFRGTTLGDELKNSGYHSRIISLALKDRAAILMGGYRADLALWYDVESSAWVSSKFYLKENKLPSWVETLNQRLAKNKDQTLPWTLPQETASGTSLANNSLILVSKNADGIGREFPHAAKAGSSFSLMLPFGPHITIDAAIAALTELKLGQGSDPDVLALSFSSHDFLSHSFGPNSREIEELTVVEDHEIARLLTQVAQQVGMENVVVVLTADHGAPPNPDWLKTTGVAAGRIDDQVIREKGEAFLRQIYGKPQGDNWISHALAFNFYLNHSSIIAAGLDFEAVEQKLVKFYRDLSPPLEGIAEIFASSDVRTGRLPGALFANLIKKTYVFGRSGDLMMIVRPNYITNDATTTHISGYSYDRMVPLIIAGSQIKSGIYGQKAEIVDIAPTLSFLSGTTPPSGSEGRILHEVLQDGSAKTSLKSNHKPNLP